ncbi:rho guanine nucleotide exchange factor 39-like [Periplaneta americana]|uniref:rho guanine nucleotide exchange factor 39-like n=1 Tax=Periplaneta americana TaxID=6978 RepID=UPI0037E8E828
MAVVYNTPQRQLTLSAELRNVINEHHIFTTRTRMKVLTALDDINKNSIEEKEKSLRYQTIQEILTSEVSYLHQLEVIMKFFMEPLKKKTFISHSTYMTLFGHIESLYNVNGELLNELKLNPEHVAASFLKLAPFFKLYSVYAYDYKEAMAVLQDLQKTNPVLNSFIANQESRPEVATKLMSLLIAPIQRIPRYRLLLKEVVSHTPHTHPDYGVLLASLHEVEKAANHINGLVQEQENMQRMVKLQACLSRGRPRIVTPGRRLLKEGTLLKVSPQGRKSHSRYFILFNDMVLYCKMRQIPPTEPNSLKCCCILPLKKCSIEEILSKGMFKLTCQNETLILCAANTEEGEGWISALRTAVKQYQDCRQTLRKDSSSRRPIRRPYACDMSQEDLLFPVKRIKTSSKQDVSLKDSLYPLRASMKRKECTQSGGENMKKRPRSAAGLPESSDVVSSSADVDHSQSVTQSWCAQGTQVLRSLASSFTRAIRRHLLRT